jgi:hypothetical protein
MSERAKASWFQSASHADFISMSRAAFCVSMKHTVIGEHLAEACDRLEKFAAIHVEKSVLQQLEYICESVLTLTADNDDTLQACLKALRRLLETQKGSDSNEINIV